VSLYLARAGPNADPKSSPLRPLTITSVLTLDQLWYCTWLVQDRAQLQAVVTRLARAGASLEVADLEGRTALHLAAGCGDAAMVAHLLHLSADVNATDSVGGEIRL